MLPHALAGVPPPLRACGRSAFWLDDAVPIPKLVFTQLSTEQIYKVNILGHLRD